MKQSKIAEHHNGQEIQLTKLLFMFWKFFSFFHFN